MRVEGRDMGEIKNISPVLNPPILGASGGLKGEMRDFLYDSQPKSGKVTYRQAH